MCGIVGYISETYYELDEALNKIKHRGPDGFGKYYHVNERLNVGFGHVRLSIIDLKEEANQPMYSKDGRYVIVFNGEIYNYKILKETYLNNYIASTSSDTEILLALFEKLGKKMLPLLEGMFAFAILDKKLNKVFMARDQLGIKPLYYSTEGGQFIFGSEIKIFECFKVEKRVDTDAITEFLLNGFIYEPNTGFKNIFKLPAGHYLEFCMDEVDRTDVVPEVFWAPSVKSRTKPEELEGLIKDSIANHLVSDVPVGLFFSGGVDSSILLFNTDKNVTALTVKSETKDLTDAGMSNDYYYSELIASQEDRALHAITLDNLSDKPFFDELEEVVLGNEELISDYTFLASKHISNEARLLNKKVVLSGMGADELFGGYPRYVLLRYPSLMKNLLNNPLSKKILKVLAKTPRFSKKINRLISFVEEPSFIYQYASLVGVFPKIIIEKLLIEKYHRFDIYEKKINGILAKIDRNITSLKKAIYLDLFGFLSHNFSVADKSSMASSVEMRVPLATSNLFDFSFNLSDDRLIKHGKTKIILKKYLGKFLAKNIINRQKAGFNPPLDSKINLLGESLIINYLELTPIFEFISVNELKRILNIHFKNEENNTYLIYNLLYLGAWLKACKK